VGRHEAAGFWFAAVPEERWPTDPQWRASVRKLWQGEHGDRRQELVFIGIGMDEPRLRAWSRLPDPFPRWSEAA
jgi:hypothetical protein